MGDRRQRAGPAALRRRAVLRLLAATWLGQLAEGKAAALLHLQRALHVYFRSLIEPHLEVVDRALRIECAGGIQRYVHAAGARLLAGRDGGDHVSALLGRTRATILRSAVTGGTTTRLAKQAGVAPATVSHHTGVLREAGLITTDRHENLATHHITPLGLAVLGNR